MILQVQEPQAVNRVPEIQFVDLKVSFLPEVLIFKSSQM